MACVDSDSVELRQCGATCTPELGYWKRDPLAQLTQHALAVQDPAHPPHPVAPLLAGVPETMLWALHNRAAEAGRHDGVLTDPACLHIHGRIDYDFAARFGPPAGSLAVRAAAIDGALRRWLERHPDGIVVSLGEGLETQLRRVDNGRMRWLSVDLPEAISLRERFLPPTDRFRHCAISAADPAWMDEVDPSAGVFIVAQGLLMYLDPALVGALLSGIAERFPGAEIVFDAIPRWFSELTMSGVQQTPQYRLPPMPWGINTDEIAGVLRGWHPRLAQVAFLDYGAPRGFWRLAGEVIDRIPLARHAVPSLVQVSVGEMPGSDGAAAPDVVGMAEVRGRLAAAWFERAAAPFLTMGYVAMAAQAAAFAPIRVFLVGKKG